MSFSIVKLVNSIPGIENRSYLELGVWDGKNHAQILCKDKVCVDIDKPATFTMPTDQYFAQENRPFDIVFIDADHRLEQAVRDYNNSIKRCKEVLFFHDLYPDYTMQATETGDYAGDVYRLLYYLISRGDTNFYVLNGDCGMTVMFPPFKEVDIRQITKVSHQNLVDLNIRRFSIPELQRVLKYRSIPKSWYIKYITAMLPVIAGLLEEAGITYWLDWGTLLGAVRDGGAIPWDFDADLGAFIEDREGIARLTDKAKELGYTLAYYPQYHKFRFFGDKGEAFHVDIDLWEPRENVAVALFDTRHEHPMQSLINHSSIEFEGRKYPCPTNPVETIMRMVGPDWKLPKISQGNVIYLNKYASYLLPFTEGFEVFISSWDKRGQK